MTDILVIGALHLDVIVNAPRLPRLDETLVGQSVTYAFGGKGGNQAAAAARMGAATAFAGRVGDDGFAAQLLAELDTARIDRTQVMQDEGASGMSVAIVDENGDYGAVIVSAANLNIDPDDISIPDGTKLLMLQNEVPATVNAALMERAADRDIPVIWNAAPARQKNYRKNTEKIHLILNRVEAHDMTGSDDPHTAATALRAQGYASVILTLGPDGTLLATANELTHHLAHKVPVISTHGAGDMFCGALAARLIADEPIENALQFAQAAAAIHVSTPVDQRKNLIPTDVTTFLQSR